ncbi:DUF5710 domain-containing protein [Geotalea uraniireducens]|uniref:DUF5710 domain-containing protein n=1 Tax=Geotalea uraniireducens TaxID=351604 RepID=UPI0032B44EFB
MPHDGAAVSRDRAEAKAAGSRWNPEKKLWYVSCGNVIGTALEKYIDIDGFDKWQKTSFHINVYSYAPYRCRWIYIHP